VVNLWGRRWTRDELLARVGAIEQFAAGTLRLLHRFAPAPLSPVNS